MSRDANKQSDKLEAIERLREWIKPGDTLYTQLQHVSRSGMSRVIDVRKIDGENILSLGWNVAKALGDTYDREREGVKVSGAGMDMGFHLIYNLGWVLFPNGFDCIGDRCPSNDHSNREHNKHHKDGGYALRHKWL